MKAHAAFCVTTAVLVAASTAPLHAGDRSALYHPPKMDALFKNLGPAMPYGAISGRTVLPKVRVVKGQLGQIANRGHVVPKPVSNFSVEAAMTKLLEENEDPLESLRRRFLEELKKNETAFDKISFGGVPALPTAPIRIDAD